MIWTYFLVLGGCLLATLPLELVFKAGVYRRLPIAVTAIAPVAVVFIAWDYLAAHTGWWSFNERYVVGISVGILPLEELLFFLVVPLCAILTLEGVRHFKPNWALARAPRIRAGESPRRQRPQS